MYGRLHYYTTFACLHHVSKQNNYSCNSYHYALSCSLADSISRLLSLQNKNPSERQPVLPSWKPISDGFSHHSIGSTRRATDDPRGPAGLRISYFVKIQRTRTVSNYESVQFALQLNWPDRLVNLQSVKREFNSSNWWSNQILNSFHEQLLKLY